VHLPSPTTWLRQGQSLSSPTKYLASSCEFGCRPRCKGEGHHACQMGADLSSGPGPCGYGLTWTLEHKRNHVYADGRSAGTDVTAPGNSVTWRALTDALVRLRFAQTHRPKRNYFCMDGRLVGADGWDTGAINSMGSGDPRHRRLQLGRGPDDWGHKLNCTRRHRDMAGVDVCAHAVAAADVMDGETPRPLLSKYSRHSPCDLKDRKRRKF
jgi:hypothetical protein